MTAVIALVTLSGLGLVGSWLDITKRRLPNWLCGLALLLGLAAALIGGTLPILGWHALHVLVALAVAMGLYAIDVIGAGDAKFYAGMAAWFPIQEGLRLFVAVAMAGLVLLVFFLILRRSRGQKLFSREARSGDGLPYGVAIAGGAWLLAVETFVAA